MLIEQDRIASQVSAKMTKLKADRDILVVKRDKIERKISKINRVLRGLSRLVDTEL
jgi:chaperonin cofactor prefoldin